MGRACLLLLAYFAIAAVATIDDDDDGDGVVLTTIESDASVVASSASGGISMRRTAADVLLTEIREAEREIEERERRLKKLTELRKLLLLETDDDVVFSSADVLEEWLRRKSTKEAQTETPRRARFENHVVSRARVETKEGVSQAIVLSLEPRRRMFDRSKKRKLAYPPNILAIANKDGSLSLAHVNGTRVISSTFAEAFGTGHQAPVIRMTYDFSRRGYPRLITAAEDGSVHAHRVTVWCHGRVVLGYPKRFDASDVLVESEDDPRFKAAGSYFEKASTDVGMVVRIELDAILVDASEVTSDLDRREVTTLGALRFKDNEVVAVGDVGGEFRVFSTNGTMLAMTSPMGETEDSEKEKHPVRVVRPLGSRLTFAVGRRVKIIDVNLGKDQFVDCAPTEHPITDVVFDVLRPSFMFVATEVGDLLVYELVGRGRSLKTYTCVLAHRSADGGVGVAASPHHVKLASARGYVVMLSSASGGTLRMFNTTGIADGRLELLAEKREFLGSDGADDAEVILSTTPAPRFGGDEIAEFLALVSRRGDDNVRVVQLLLPYHRPTSAFDISTLRVPIMMLGGIIVAIVFYRSRKQKETPPSGPGGLKDFDMADFKRFMGNMERNGGLRGAGAGVGDGRFVGGKGSRRFR